MAAQKGSAVLIKVDISGTPTTIGGLRSSSITLNEEMVDVTTKDSANQRTILPAAGVQSMSISGSGVFTDAASEGTIRTNFGGAALQGITFVIPDLGSYDGDFLCTSLEYAGEYNGEATYSMSFESSGAVTFTSA
jgi:TP901-1 family phage major tail protein